MTSPTIQQWQERWRKAPRPWGQESGFRREANNFDILRLLLALIVLFFHGAPLLGSAEEFPSLADFAREPREQVYLIGIRVCCFFWMSGFLVAHSWERAPDAFRFLQRRALRLYPSFVVCFFLCLLIVPHLAHGLNALSLVSFPALGNMIACFLTFRIPPVFGLFPDNAISDTLNGSLWTLLYEAWCCALLVILGLLGIVKNGRALLLLSITTWSVYLLQWFGILHFPLTWENSTTWTIFGSMEAYPRLLSCFLAGVLFYRFRQQIPWSTTGFVVFGGLLLLALSLGLTGPALPLLGAYPLAYLVFHPRWRIFPRFARIGGDLSYGIFLYGYPIQQLLIHHTGEVLSPTTLFLVTLPPTLVIAYLSNRFIEKPIAAWTNADKKKATIQPQPPAISPRPTSKPAPASLNPHRSS